MISSGHEAAARTSNQFMKTIVIGLGNPYLTDDGVGIKIVRELCAIKKERRCLSDASVDLTEAYSGGLGLLDIMIGYDRAVIIDAMVTGRYEAGSIQMVPLSDLLSTKNLVCAHDTNLHTAVEIGKMLDAPMPSDIIIWGIEGKDVATFGDDLSQEVKNAMPHAVERIALNLFGGASGL
ncbi:MAG: hydrogenase maturation protease [Nitrospirae bacterium]|nr:hydrogenase maturation protease [Nitrospirota bacterium]